MLARDVLKIDVEKFSRKFHVPRDNLISLIGQARVLLGQ